MIRTSLMNFAKNYKWLIFSFLIFAALIGVLTAVLFLGILMPIENADAGIHAVLTAHLGQSLTSINLTDAMSADYLQGLVSGIYDSVTGLGGTLKTVIVIELIVCALLIFATPHIVSFFALGKMREDVSTKHTKRGIWVAIMRVAIGLIFSGLYILIAYFWFFAIFLLPLVSQIVNAFQSLFVTKYVYYHDFPRGQIINPINAAFLTLSNIMLMYLCLVIIFGVSFINLIAAIAIALPLLTYNACIRDVTAAGYFKKLLEDGKLKKAANAQKH